MVPRGIQFHQVTTVVTGLLVSTRLDVACQAPSLPGSLRLVGYFTVTQLVAPLGKSPALTQP